MKVAGLSDGIWLSPLRTPRSHECHYWLRASLSPGAVLSGWKESYVDLGTQECRGACDWNGGQSEYRLPCSSAKHRAPRHRHAGGLTGHRSRSRNCPQDFTSQPARVRTGKLRGSRLPVPRPVRVRAADDLCLCSSVAKAGFCCCCCLPIFSLEGDTWPGQAHWSQGSNDPRQ